MQRLIRISVRELVSFVLRCGDLERGAFVSPQSLLAGTRTHQVIQRSRPPGYQAEVPVVYWLERDDVRIQVTGRVDGLVAQPDRLLVEEIKTTRDELDASRLDNPLHRAQVRVYAWILATQCGYQEADIRLTYVRLEPFATLQLEERCTIDDLAALGEDLLERYLVHVRANAAWCEARNTTIHALRFPFATARPGQLELMRAVAHTIGNDGRLYVQAPTGIGKTVSVLRPAVQALEAGHVEKIFYLTPKTVVRTAAEKAVEDLRRAGLRLRSLTLTARERICFQETPPSGCNPLLCAFARGYYDRIHAALTDCLAREICTREVIESLARQHSVCPFELSLELSLWSDLIICDYNYVFDPRAYLRRFFADGGGPYAFLIDEAHNLVDRAREMFSADLRKSTVLAVRRRLPPDQQELRRQLDRLNRFLLELGRRGDTGAPAPGWTRLEQRLDGLPELLRDFLASAATALGQRPNQPWGDALLDLYFLVTAFLRVQELVADDYVTCVERSGRDLCLRLFCVDPARNLRDALQRGQAAVFFSATLAPLEYFRDLLGGAADDTMLDLTSPFPPENLHVMMADRIATTYRERGGTYEQVAAAIQAAIAAKTGNYMAFFPSFRYLRAVLGCFLMAAPGVDVLAQKPGMSETERQAFLDVFGAENDRTVVGFAVMGGLFGEGIDLTGDRLVGAVIVGVGLPQLGPERDLLRSHYDDAGAPGFDYAYTFPGMNRVLQAAGRVIRSESDRGIVLLIDQRFGHARYEHLFPRWWRPIERTRTPAAIRRSVECFWSGIRDTHYESLEEMYDDGTPW